MGLHEYFQMNSCAYGDFRSRLLNKEIYSTIKTIAEETTTELGFTLGSPKMCEEAGLVRRNVSLQMVAPNKSTSFIFGNTSLGVEPFLSNYFVKELAGIQTTFRNPYLEKLLITKEKNTPEVWDSILTNIGSVQHLDFLSKDEKDIFLTANEISPKDMIDLAADRQVFIDMAQSLNLFNRPNYTLQDIYNIHIYAFDKGIKTLYYYYPQGHSSIERVGESWDTCVNCAD